MFEEHHAGFVFFHALTILLPDALRLRWMISPDAPWKNGVNRA